MSRQVSTRTVNLRGIMRSAPFVRGFNESIAGKPYDYDIYSGVGETDDRWNYERGRTFGCIFKGPLKYGRTTNDAAIYACGDAIYSGIII